MGSLYLGRIGSEKGVYEIHAFTKDLPFREFDKDEIADEGLFNQLLEARYNVLDGGRAIFCTAVNPDNETKKESNPHDYREGTVHITAVDNDGRIVCALSTAVDTGYKERGDPIGVPLENRWKPNGYPAGASLDRFREVYAKRILSQNREVEPWELAEIYRHFIDRSNRSSLAPRLGVYTGAYHLLVREAKKKGKRPTSIWVFDAIPAYFKLYKLVGASVLRDPSIEEPPRLISPDKRELENRVIGGEKTLFYKGEAVSRIVPVPIPSKENGELEFHVKGIPFLDGVVNTEGLEESIRKRPLLFFPVDGDGFSLKDRMQIRATLSTVGKRALDHNDRYNKIRKRTVRDRVSDFGDNISRKLTDSDIWEFSDIGDINHVEKNLYQDDI